MKRKLRQLKSSELKKLRKHLHKKQGMVCPIINQSFPLAEMVVDHQHKTKAEVIGKGGAGLVRGCIQRQANVIEGKLSNAYRRYGLHKYDISLPDFLRNLADYLERDNLPLIHPNEKPKPQKLMKSSYNKLKKRYNNAPCRTPLPDFPKSGKMIKALDKLYDHYNLEPEFYSK